MAPLWFRLLSLPSSILLSLLSMVGLAAWPREIVRTMPRNPAFLPLKRGRKTPKVKANGHGVNGLNGHSSHDGEDGRGTTLAEWIYDNVPSLKGTFKPAWWLPNGHLQTMFSVVGNFTKVDNITYSRTYLRVPDGGTLGLDFTEGYNDFPPEAPFVVICHGLTGGSHESYVRNVLTEVVKARHEGGLGGRAVVVNLYSAGNTIDMGLALHYLRANYPSAPLFGIGFSLGASTLTNYVGETSSSCLLSGAIAVGCPWNLPGMSVRLEGDAFHRIVYSGAMAHNVMRIFFRQYDHHPAVWDREDWFGKECVPQLKRMRKSNFGVRLKDVDEVLTSHLGGPRGEGLWPFNGAEGYYAFASPYQRVEGVKRPLLAINAFDDPIIDGKYLPVDQVHASSHVYLAVTGSGGHLGWFDGPFWGTKPSKHRWITAPVLEFLHAATRDLDVEGGAVEVENGGAPGEGDAGGEGWTWVTQGGHEVQGGGRRGWRVLKEGVEVESKEGTGALQGF